MKDTIMKKKYQHTSCFNKLSKEYTCSLENFHQIIYYKSIQQISNSFHINKNAKA